MINAATKGVLQRVANKKVRGGRLLSSVSTRLIDGTEEYPG